MGDNSSELVAVNSTIAKLLGTVDKLKADIKLAIHKRLGDLSVTMSTTACIRTKTAWVSKNWNHNNITFATAICNLVQYSHSQSSEINDRAKITAVNSLDHKLTNAIVTNKNNISSIETKINGIDIHITTINSQLNTILSEQELINQRLDDLLLNNIATINTKIDNLMQM